MRRMIARTVRASSSRSTPAIPRQIAAGVMPWSPIAASITPCSTFSTASSPAAWRFAPGPRPSDTIAPRSSARRHTVFVPPASMPKTCITFRLLSGVEVQDLCYVPKVSLGFSAIDYAVLAVYLAGITLFGSQFRKSHHTVKDYFLGTRQTSWVVISLSIVATETSTLTLVGVPALAYTVYPRAEQGGSFTYLQVVAGYIVARFVISALFIPAYFQCEMLTAYELLNRRFGPHAKHFAASLFLLMRALAEGVRVFAASLVLAAVLSASVPGLPHLWLWSIVIVGLLTLVYTFEGGIAAVIWTDLVQLVIYVGGSLLAAYMLVHLVPGGWTAIVDDARAAGKLRLVSWSWDMTVPFTFWAGLIGGCFLTMASHGTDQLMVQRLLTCRQHRERPLAALLSGFVVF